MHVIPCNATQATTIINNNNNNKLLIGTMTWMNLQEIMLNVIPNNQGMDHTLYDSIYMTFLK